MDLTASGTDSDRIVFDAYGTGELPVINEVDVDGSFTTLQNLVVDHGKQSGDAIQIRSASNVTLRDMVVRNGTSDGIDVDKADGLLIDGLLIHHFLAGSFTAQADAHGIVATDTDGLTIRNTEIHHVSGDSFQTDPDRDTDITTNVLIEDSHFWTAPLQVDFNSSWLAGERPGENAIDTKVVKEDWESVPRMQMTVRNVTANGWQKDSFISNKAAFNIKEKVDVVFDGVTVYDNEIAFRLRGTRGNADVTIINGVIHDNEKAIRAEDDLANLTILNTTFGDGTGTTLEFAGGSAGTGSWDLKNNAFLAEKPSVASDASNLTATTSDFVDTTSADYQLAAGSVLIDAGTTLAEVPVDRDGTARPQGAGYDVGSFEQVAVTSYEFDFGPAGSVVAEDHVGIDPSLAYQSSVGYGFTSGSLNSRDRNGPDDLRRDFVFGKDYEFVVDVANGSYEVTTVIGDASYATPGLGLYLEGVLTGTHASARGEFISPMNTVEVTDGQLNVRLASTVHALLNGLEIMAVSPRLAVEFDEQLINENGGVTTGTLTRVGDSTGELTVSLTSDLVDVVSFPQQVVFAEGSNTTSFTISAINNTLFEGRKRVLISAAADGYRAGEDFVRVADDEGVQIAVNFTDADGEGFFDPTLGEVRQEAFQWSIDILSALFEKSYGGETIVVEAAMDPLGANVLGEAGATTIHRDFPNAPVGGTWYVAPLANHLAGQDLNGNTAEISSTFSSDANWYYGTDANPGNQYDFVTVILHEVAHGLGFLDLIKQDGSYFAGGLPGIWDRFLEIGDGTDLVDMTQSERAAALVSNDLYWAGVGGRLGNDNARPRLFAPSSFSGGSSTSHLDEGIHGGELMSPYLTSVNHVFSAMEKGILSDMGWDLPSAPS